MQTNRLVVSAALAAALVLSACKKQAAQYVSPGPPEVTVASAVEKTVPDFLEYTGLTRASDAVEIRARVRGFLQKKHVRGGNRVKQGDLLFTIDPRTYLAVVKQAEAEVEVRRANLRLAEVSLGRLKTAIASSAASEQELDRGQAERDVAAAQLELAEAQLLAAKLDLEFTEVRAPISGRLGLIPPDEGDLVGSGEATLLTTLVNDELIYATYEIDERTLLELRRANQNKRPGEDGRPLYPVYLATSAETEFTHKGVFDKADATVNPDTGTVRVEAAFENTDGSLVAGLFVRIRPMIGERTALMLPDVAVLSDQSGKYVLVVGPDGVVERRNITAGPIYGRERRVDAGLAAADQVIVNGIQRARPGGKVNPIRQTAPAPAVPPTAPANPSTP